MVLTDPILDVSRANRKESDYFLFADHSSQSRPNRMLEPTNANSRFGVLRVYTTSTALLSLQSRDFFAARVPDHMHAGPPHPRQPTEQSGERCRVPLSLCERAINS